MSDVLPIDEMISELERRIGDHETIWRRRVECPFESFLAEKVLKEFNVLPSDQAALYGWPCVASGPREAQEVEEEVPGE